MDKTFPKHWGHELSFQAGDCVELPYGYGEGSSTLAKWIEKKVNEDMLKVIEFSYNAHEGQFRKDGKTPYIEHPEEVASLIAVTHNDFTAEMVAWLHDVVEDTPATLEDLRGIPVDEEVIEAVDVLSKKEGVSYEDYLDGVKRNPLARKVKVADMLANLTDNPSGKQIVKYTRGLMFLASS